MRALAEALRFLSILPLPGRPPKSPGAVLAAYPWAGLVIGLLTAAGGLAASFLFGPAGTAAAAVTLRIVLTGGLHMDGLADLADGLGAAGDRERRLEVMADSRLGTYGVLALLLMVLLQIAVTAELLRLPADLLRSPSAGIAGSGAAAGGLPILMPGLPPGIFTLLPLVMAPAVTRGMLPLMMRVFPPARPNGMGDRIRAAAVPAAVTGAIIGALLISSMLGGARGGVSALFAAVLMFLIARRTSRTLGGLTGDVYGALVETGDLAFLTGMLILGRLSAAG